jgi:hypothetical protein
MVLLFGEQLSGLCSYQTQQMHSQPLYLLVVGAGAAWFGLYVGGTRQSKTESKES